MIDEKTKRIRSRAHELCREILPVGRNIFDRNEIIIKKLMEEFSLSHEEAEYQFENNNNLEE